MAEKEGHQARRLELVNAGQLFRADALFDDLDDPVGTLTHGIREAMREGREAEAGRAACAGSAARAGHLRKATLDSIHQSVTASAIVVANCRGYVLHPPG